MVKIRFFGILSKQFRKEYNLDVKSVGEAMHAINILNKRKLFPALLENDKKGIRYKILINNKPFKADSESDFHNNIHSVAHSKLVSRLRNLQSIDIVPVIEGADDGFLGIFTLILGAILIIASFGTFGAISPALSAAFAIGGVALVAGGIASLLSKPPEFDDFRDITNGGKTSYLFNGPQNTVREGGPVPVGYGRLLVGSQVIAASYQVVNVSADAKVNNTLPGDPVWGPQGGTLVDGVFAMEFDFDGNVLVPVGGATAESPGGFQGDGFTKSSIGISKLNINNKNQLVWTPAVEMSTSMYIVPQGTNNQPKIYALSTVENRLAVGGNQFSAIARTEFAGRFQTTTFLGESKNVLVTQYDTKLVSNPTRGGVSESAYYAKDSFYIGMAGDVGDSRNAGFYSTANGTKGYVNGTVYDVQAIRPSSNAYHLFVGGDFQNYNETSAGYLSKINQNTAGLDSTFQTNINTQGLNGAVRSVDVLTDSDGAIQNILIGGDFTDPYPYFMRLNADGTDDAAFNTNIGDTFDAPVYDIARQSDGKILVAGKFTSAMGSRRGFVRINTDGSLDSSFPNLNITLTSSPSDFNVRTIAVQRLNDYILLGGYFNEVDGTACSNIIRVTDVGVVDTNFICNTDGEVRKILVRDNPNYPQYDGQIFIGGKFTKVNAQPYVNFAALFNGSYINTDPDA